MLSERGRRSRSSRRAPRRSRRPCSRIPWKRWESFAGCGTRRVAGRRRYVVCREPLAARAQRVGGSRQSLPDVPAVAVLPFLNLSGDPEQDYFSDGITEDILTELSRARDLRVLARNTTFQYKGKAVDVGKLGRELGVRYVLEGSIRRSDDRLRVTAQLIDTMTGTHIWADRYDREMADVFLVQDEIVNQIVAKIAGSYGAIELNEAKAVARKSPEQFQAYDFVLRAREILQWDWTSDNFSAAREALNRAISLDPFNAQAQRELAWLAVIGWIFRLDETPIPPEEITAQATKAVELNPADARARMVAASAYFFTKQLDSFAREADQALTLAPYDAEIMAVLACMISSQGDHKRGCISGEGKCAESQRRHGLVSLDRLHGRLSERRLRARAQSGEAEPRRRDVLLYLEIIPIFGQLGLQQEALDAWKKIQAQLPDASANTFEDWWRLWNTPEAEIAKLMEGVHKSGVFGAEG